MSKRTRSKGTTQHPSDSPAAEEVISQVKENLARQGRTLDDLSRETGLSKGVIEGWLRGAFNLRTEKVISIQMALMPEEQRKRVQEAKAFPCGGKVAKLKTVETASMIPPLPKGSNTQSQHVLETGWSPEAIDMEKAVRSRSEMERLRDLWRSARPQSRNNLMSALLFWACMPEKLAAKTRLSSSRIERYLAGTEKLEQEACQRIADALEMDPALLSDETDQVLQYGTAGQEIRKLREIHEEDENAMARRLAVTPDQLRSIERGETQPAPDTMLGLSFLGLDILLRHLDEFYPEDRPDDETASAPHGEKNGVKEPDAPAPSGAEQRNSRNLTMEVAQEALPVPDDRAEIRPAEKAQEETHRAPEETEARKNRTVPDADAEPDTEASCRADIMTLMGYASAQGLAALYDALWEILSKPENRKLRRGGVR